MKVKLSQAANERLQELAVSKNMDKMDLLKEGLKLIVDYMDTHKLTEYEVDDITYEPPMAMTVSHTTTEEPVYVLNPDAPKFEKIPCKKKRKRRGGRKHKKKNPIEE